MNTSCPSIRSLRFHPNQDIVVEGLGFVKYERALGPFRGNNTWMSRVRVRRVAHAVLWGDGLRFRVRDGRLLSSRAHTIDRGPSVCGGPAAWFPFLPGSLAWGDGPRQQIRIPRRRVTRGRAQGVGCR